MGPATGRLQLRIAPDGSACVHGVIRLRGDAGTTVLVAESDTAQASCADANGNGTAGLTRLQFQARHLRSGELVPVALTVVAGADLDQNGFGFVTFQVGEHAAAEARFRVRRRRRSRRGGQR